LINIRLPHLVHSSIRSSISEDDGFANLSEDSPVKSFVAEDEAALAVTVARRSRVLVLFMAVKQGVALLQAAAGAVCTESTEASILSEWTSWE
jgi:hypothetical protein